MLSLERSFTIIGTLNVPLQVPRQQGAIKHLEAAFPEPAALGMCTKTDVQNKITAEKCRARTGVVGRVGSLGCALKETSSLFSFVRLDIQYEWKRRL